MSEHVESEFTSSHGGNFMERFGPTGRDGQYSQKKVCLVATDQHFLIRFLYEVSLREDCYYVKYSTRPRDGMYLGRCFLATDADAARLCRGFKAHPKFLVSIQDDDFFNQFRAV